MCPARQPGLRRESETLLQGNRHTARKTGRDIVPPGWQSEPPAMKCQFTGPARLPGPAMSKNPYAHRAGGEKVTAPAELSYSFREDESEIFQRSPVGCCLLQDFASLTHIGFGPGPVVERSQP